MLRKLWADESGAVIASEYLLLGSAVTTAAAVGLGSMRDAVVSEYKQFGHEVREVRRQHTPVTGTGVEKTEPRTGEVTPCNP